MGQVSRGMSNQMMGDCIAIKTSRQLLLLILIISLVGCSTPVPTQETPVPEATLTPTTAPVVTIDEDEPEAEGPVTLRIWVPPEFDPTKESAASEIFLSRLDEFAVRKPNVNIEVRSKNVYGIGGILDTLTTASAAAPLALPDLVALPRHGLETAADVGVLFPYDSLTTVLDDPDWYEYARQLSYLQNSTFGIPFAGDALIMAYRPEIVPEPPIDWNASLAITTTLSYPAASPNALYTLAQYQALGAPILDENEQPSLDVIYLTQVLSYYQQASATELMPFWLTQFETDEQSWEAYQDSHAVMAITWATRYLQTNTDDTSDYTIPLYQAGTNTKAHGWVWE